MRDATGQHAGLARAGAGDDQQRAAAMLDRLVLGGIQAIGELGERRRGGTEVTVAALMPVPPIGGVRGLGQTGRGLRHRALLHRGRLVIGRLVLIGRLLLLGRPLGAATLVTACPLGDGGGHRHPVESAEGVGQREVVEE